MRCRAARESVPNSLSCALTPTIPDAHVETRASEEPRVSLSLILHLLGHCAAAGVKNDRYGQFLMFGNCFLGRSIIYQSGPIYFITLHYLQVEWLVTTIPSLRFWIQWVALHFQRVEFHHRYCWCQCKGRGRAGGSPSSSCSCYQNQHMSRFQSHCSDQSAQCINSGLVTVEQQCCTLARRIWVGKRWRGKQEAFWQ